MNKKFKMVAQQILLYAVTRLVDKFIDLVVKIHKDNTEFITDLKKRWDYKKAELEDGFTAQNVSSAKQKASDIITDIREFFDDVINDHFVPEVREKIKKDVRKQLKKFIPVMEKTTKNVKKDLDSLLSLVKEVKKNDD